MCGIFGCVLKQAEAAPVIRSALQRLEYRGYDSVGLAVISDGHLNVKKDAGRIDEVNERLRLDELKGSVGIGHTRWATHGAPSQENAHPHEDCRNEIALVHNGIIENFLDLRKELEARGHQFRSRTDTEAIVHLIEEELKSRSSLHDAVRKTCQRIRGSYAIGVVSTREPDKVIAARKESPLVIGVGEKGVYLASDIPAFLDYTRDAIQLEEDELAILTKEGFELSRIESGERIKRNIVRISWTPETAVRAGFDHFMLKEIHEQPSALADALRTQDIYYELIGGMLNKAERIFFVSCGTSFHACMVGSYALAKIACLHAYPVVSSEFLDQYAHLINSNTVVVTVSQSGETADTLNAVREAKKRGASIVGITNVMGSTLTRLADVYVGQNSGPEIGVAATKTFTAQVSVLLKLAVMAARLRGALSADKIKKYLDDLSRSPLLVSQTLQKTESRVREIATQYHESKSFCFLGRGVNVATALEGRLKLLELSYIPSLAYPAGESKHGFIAAIEPGFPVVFIAPRDESYPKIIGNVMEMKARGASIITLVEAQDSQVGSLADARIDMPESVPETIAPIVYVIPLQLLAYYISVLRGADPDRPRNLAKSVTVE